MMQHEDRNLGAPPIPYGPHAVDEALAMIGRIVTGARRHSQAWIERKAAAR